MKALRENLKALTARDKLRSLTAEDKLKAKTTRDKLKAEIEKHRWIPVSERLPKAGRHVLLLDSKTGRVYVSWTSKACEERVTHWKPIILPS